MGYKVVRTIYNLKFTEREGMEVRARGADVEGFTRLAGLAKSARSDKTEEALDTIQEMFARFAKILIDWNLEEEDGTPIAATAEGLGSLEFDLALEIVLAWIEAVSDVAVPLVNSSTPGEMQEVAASLQMESLSPNPLSLPVPS